MALDQITKALVEEFNKIEGLQAEGEAVDFEKFAAHVSISPLIESYIDFENVVVAEGNDTGLDAIAIIVNGSLVTDLDALKEIVESGASLDVHFVFVQAESKRSFSTQKIGQILAGVLDFFRVQPILVRNNSVNDAAEIANYIMDNARLFHRANPVCTVNYVTVGRLTGDHDLTARMAQAKNDIEDLNIFSEVTFNLVDAQSIQRMYRSLSTGVEREFRFENKVSMPDINQVTEAHLGYLPAKELVKVLSDKDGNLLPSVFYDNVRDYQGASNKVNSEIGSTLMDESRARFPLLNNGVTIIAKSLRQTGNRFIIQDFQVVNGCQTCNVLWDNKDVLEDDVHVPLRLISTEDDDVILNIIRATNRQTEVREEQFFATGEYLKQLELYFETESEARRLFLERRSKQYVNAPIERTRVVAFNNLVRSFASLVLAEPHRSTRNYKALLNLIPDSILNPDHKPSVYFATASSLYRLEFLFRNGVLDRKFSPAKYHLLLASRLIASPGSIPKLNSGEADRWANGLADTYWDAEASERIFLKAAHDIEDLAEGDLSRDRIRTQPFTQAVLDFYQSPRT